MQTAMQCKTGQSLAQNDSLVLFVPSLLRTYLMGTAIGVINDDSHIPKRQVDDANVP